jgi:hypothetical protein
MTIALIGCAAEAAFFHDVAGRREEGRLLLARLDRPKNALFELVDRIARIDDVQHADARAEVTAYFAAHHSRALDDSALRGLRVDIQAAQKTPELGDRAREVLTALQQAVVVELTRRNALLGG